MHACPSKEVTGIRPLESVKRGKMDGFRNSFRPSVPFFKLSTLVVASKVSLPNKAVHSGPFDWLALGAKLKHMAVETSRLSRSPLLDLAHAQATFVWAQPLGLRSLWERRRGLCETRNGGLVCLPSGWAAMRCFQAIQIPVAFCPTRPYNSKVKPGQCRKGQCRLTGPFVAE